MASSICPNCGSKLTCGCQKRVASDGKQCCGVCINGYEAKLRVKNKPKAIIDPKLTINKVTVRIT